jgi:hypothetical protein
MRHNDGAFDADVDDLPSFVEAVLKPGSQGSLTAADTQRILEKLDHEVQCLANEIKEERNRLREKRREVSERTRPPWLSPLIRKLRSFFEHLPEEQYLAFLSRWGLTDAGLGSWLDALTTGIDLDDANLVEHIRKLETAPATILETFGMVQDAVPSEEIEVKTLQLDLDFEPVVHRVEARVRNLRLNVPGRQVALGHQSARNIERRKPKRTKSR